MATNVINIREFVDVSTSVSANGTNVARDWTVPLFVMKGEDESATVIAKYDDLAAVIEGAGSNSEAAKFATKFYGTSYNGVAPTSAIYVASIAADNFDENFTALLASEDYYLIALDTNFTDAQKKSAAALAEAYNTTASHKLFLDDSSAQAFDTTLEEDLAETTPSVLATCCENKYVHTIVCVVNPSNTNKYYSASQIAYWSTRKFESSSRRMATICHKPASGIEPIDMLDSSLDVTISPTQKFKNIDSKNGNAYINVKLVGLTSWERGNLPSGDDISEYISADYLTYVLSVSVFRLLQSTPRLPMNSDGASMLGNVISQAFLSLNAAGVISGGVAQDGDVFPATGYKYVIPVPTGIKKANGLWDGIVCSALLTGSTKKVVIGNELKK